MLFKSCHGIGVKEYKKSRVMMWKYVKWQENRGGAPGLQRSTHP